MSNRVNKSEELAKTLGIQARYELVRPVALNLYTKHEIEEIQETLINTTGRTCIIIKPQEHYPDFTIPSNFVKLLEIHFKTGWGLCTWLGECNKNDADIEFINRDETFINSFINYMFRILSNQKEIVDRLVMLGDQRGIVAIKKLAQQTEWEYK